uniref:Uncharacterized protein n=1 Tax=uncultured bacterium pTW2 TaxID=504464 RepID=B8PZW1_9BACT|nr:hypothetical protein [uncultured bacterium pTW2]
MARAPTVVRRTQYPGPRGQRLHPKPRPHRKEKHHKKTPAQGRGRKSIRG